MIAPDEQIPGRTAAFDSGREAHVIYLFPEGEPFNDQESGFFDTLPAEETARAKTFKSGIARRQFLYGRFLMRRMLAAYLDVEASSLELEATDAGKLFLPGDDPSLEFNLTHKPGCIAVALAQGRAIGVDAEEYEPDHANEKIARRFFAASEVDQLKGLSRDTLAWRFYRFWTLKEAYIKARGLGMKLPLQDFAFSFDDPLTLEQAGEGIRIRFTGRIEDEPSHWRFQTRRVSDAHLISVAIRHTEPGSIPIRYFQMR